MEITQHSLAQPKTKNTALGHDGIHYTHLKHLPILATTYFAKICETCLKLKYFHNLWKASLVVWKFSRPLEGRKTTILTCFDI